jgi:GT2 family glycosyltransferase
MAGVRLWRIYKGNLQKELTGTQMTPDTATDTQRPRIGILVLNRNGKRWLPTIYDSIRLNAYPNALVYLVDNNSDDGSVEFTLDKYPDVTIVSLPQNLGYCMAYNLAMTHAFADGCEWVVWANNDVKLEPRCLERLALAAQCDSRIGIVGPAFLEGEGEEPNYYMLGNHPAACSNMKIGSRESIDVEWVEGSFLMVSRQCVQDVGPLDPYLFFYWEETDFCRRARHKGWRVVMTTAALARHYAGGWSQALEENRITANKLQTRNYYIYKVADPFSGFVHNIFDAAHLLLVQIKQNLAGKPSLAFFHLRIFANILANLPTLHRKWARDKAGKHPPDLRKGMTPVELKIIRGTSISHSACTAL